MGRAFRLTSPARVQAAENDVEAACLTVLRLRRWWLIRCHAGLFKTLDGRFIKGCEKGHPDWAAMHKKYPGFLLEVKRPGNVPTPVQTNYRQVIELSAGLTVICVDDVRTLTAFLNAHENGGHGLSKPVPA